jgi:hypothetical protein
VNYDLRTLSKIIWGQGVGERKDFPLFRPGAKTAFIPSPLGVSLKLSPGQDRHRVNPLLASTMGRA